MVEERILSVATEIPAKDHSGKNNYLKRYVRRTNFLGVDVPTYEATGEVITTSIAFSLSFKAELERQSPTAGACFDIPFLSPF